MRALGRMVLCLAVLGLALAGCGSKSSSSVTGHGAAGAGAGGRAPAGPLIGVMFDGPVLGPGVDLGHQMDLAVASGVESLRVSLRWSATQPSAKFAALPGPYRGAFTDVGGVPTSFGAFDRIVAAAAARHLSLLPVVLGTPAWANGGKATSVPPRTPTTYANFVAALVHRYGPAGSFWSSHPSLARVPIRSWQIWNEPDFSQYWSVQPFAQSYVRLLAAAHAAIKAADPGAQVVLAGLPEFSWQYMAQIYAVPGARSDFDMAAIHPYTAHPPGVITILDRVRAVMNGAGDQAKPILATEITFPSSAGKAPPQFGVGTTEAGQARLLGQVLPLLAANRARLHLSGFFWYTWMGDESTGKTPYGFDYAGLLKYVNGGVSVKPALSVFAHGVRSVEGCRRKGASADRCG